MCLQYKNGCTNPAEGFQRYSGYMSSCLDGCMIQYAMNSKDTPSRAIPYTECHRGAYNSSVRYMTVSKSHTCHLPIRSAVQARPHLQPAPNHRSWRFRRPRRTLRFPWILHPRRYRRTGFNWSKLQFSGSCGYLWFRLR